MIGYAQEKGAASWDKPRRLWEANMGKMFALKVEVKPYGGEGARHVPIHNIVNFQWLDKIPGSSGLTQIVT
ncbi:MAG: hypothetical protein ABSE43_09920 [Steroidobacteraceae bacterium]|jgi:hypothetical protein